jgi:hypothetical protein
LQPSTTLCEEPRYPLKRTVDGPTTRLQVA